MTTHSNLPPPLSPHPPSFHPSSVKLSAEAVVMATGKGSGGEPLSCIQRFSGRKVIRELVFSMLRQYERKRGGEKDRGRSVGGWRRDEKRERPGKERDEGEGWKAREGEERPKDTYKGRSGSNRAIKEWEGGCKAACGVDIVCRSC